VTPPRYLRLAFFFLVAIDGLWLLAGDPWPLESLWATLYLPVGLAGGLGFFEWQRWRKERPTFLAWARRRFLVGLAVVACATVVVAARVNPRGVGRLEFLPTGSAHRLVMRGGSFGDTAGIWTLAPDSAPGAATVLVYDDEPMWVESATDVELYTIRHESPRELVFGKSPALEWTGAEWTFGLGAEVGEDPAPLPRRAPLYVENTTDQKIRVAVQAAGGGAVDVSLGDAGWDFDPKEGTDHERGLRLTSDDENVEVSTGDLLLLAQLGDGDVVVPLGGYFVGYSERIAFAGGAWVLRLDALDLVSRVAPLRAKNPTGDSFTLEPRDQHGASLGTWDFQGGDGADQAHGNALVSGDKTILLRPGFSLRVSRHSFRRLYKGRLDGYGRAKLDSAAALWQLRGGGGR
jgi:hypothetical protein